MKPKFSKTSIKKVLFTHSFFYKFDKKRWKMMQPYAPLGTLYAASFLRENGFEVDFFDTNLKNSEEEIIPLITEFKPDILIIYDDEFNYLTKMCLTNMREAAFKIIKIGKEHGSKVIISSSDATDRFEQYLNAGADFVIPGEGEKTLLELVNSIDNIEKIKNIEGLIFTEKDKIIKTPKRPSIINLDELPQPAWDLLDIKEYKEKWLNRHGKFVMNVAMSRGCPYKCNWCAKPLFGYTYNFRSPESMANELAFLVNTYQPDEFWFCDDIFGLHKKWVADFAKLIAERQLKIKYIFQSRADLLKDKETVENLAKSGAKEVWMGVESGSQRILDAMNKGIRLEEVVSAQNLLKKNKINSAFFIQYGYPGETKADIRKTIKMILKLMPEKIGISVSYPLPGTPFYESVKDQMSEKENWTDSDDLELMFRNNFSAKYYKALHRYTHLIFLSKKAFLNFLKFHLARKDFYKSLPKVMYLMLKVIKYRLEMLKHSTS